MGQSVELTWKHYRRSTLVQGAMEIACLVTVKMAATCKIDMLAEKYLDLVMEKYTQPKDEELLDCFVTNIENYIIYKYIIYIFFIIYKNCPVKSKC